MPVSPLRDRIDRTVLGAFGVAGIALGTFAIVGIHGAASRVVTVVIGLTLLGHSIGLVRIAREGRGASGVQDQKP